MGETEGQGAVVGEQQQPFGVGVEATDREDPGIGGNQVDDNGSSLGVRGGGDDAERLVEQVVDQAGAHRGGDPVDGHLVGVGIDPAAEDRHLAVHAHPARTDEVIAFPTAPEARSGQDLLQALVVHGMAVGGGRSPRSNASTVSGPGTKSPSGGRSSREPRPSFSRNVEVVPNRAAWPGPGSWPTSSM